MPAQIDRLIRRSPVPAAFPFDQLAPFHHSIIEGIESHHRSITPTFTPTSTAPRRKLALLPFPPAAGLAVALVLLLTTTLHLATAAPLAPAKGVLVVGHGQEGRSKGAARSRSFFHRTGPRRHTLAAAVPATGSSSSGSGSKNRHSSSKKQQSQSPATTTTTAPMTTASQLRGSVAKAAAAAAATGTGNGVGGHNFVYDLIVIGGGR